MNRIYKTIKLFAVVMSVGLSMGSCVSESPFENEDGNGILRINPTFRGDVTVTTRAEGGYDQETLEKNLVVYVERKGEGGGLVRKYLGRNEIPSSISLQSGDYVVEAWTGDSVSASWDKKFYRAWQEVQIEPGNPKNMTLKCNIANVLVSVNPESLEVGLTDLNVSFWHSRKGKDNEYVMSFGQEEIENAAKGYFMMPTVNHTTGEKETVLNYLITGKKDDGSEFTKEGTLENVKAAHEYCVKIIADAGSASLSGGALVRLEIQDIPLVEASVEVFPAPVYEAYYAGSAYDLANQLDLTGEKFYNLEVTTIGYGGIKGFTLTFSENFNTYFSSVLGTESGRYSVNLTNDSDARAKFEEIGLDYDRKIVYDKINGSEDDTMEVHEIYLTLTEDFFMALPKDDKEYVVTIDANDGRYHSSSTTIRFANTDAAVEKQAPVGTPDMTKNENIDYMAVGTTTATLYGELYTDDVQNYGIKYREAGTSEWTEVAASASRGEIKRFSVTVSGLKAGTQYEYKAYCDGFEELSTRTFSTESVFVIPNAGLEDWSNLSSNNKVLIPAAGGTVSFWDTGNHGSATMNKLVTNQSSAMKHGGESSAELKSQFVGIGTIGKFAAGNLFVGSYDKTDGTDGELTFGRPYNGSHPKALTLYANYRPGVGVSKKGADASYIAEGATDEAQIYVALTSEPVSIKTKTKQLFDPSADYVVAYGQITWNGDFGTDGSLDKVTIPLEYTSRAKTLKPTHLVIVCSASKYGDFFSGGEGSVMYVDDFELEY